MKRQTLALAVFGIALMAPVAHAKVEKDKKAKPAPTTKPASTKKPDLTKDLNTQVTTRGVTVDKVLGSNKAKVDLKVRYINTMEAMQKSEAGKKASEKIEKRRLKLTNDIKAKETELKKSIEEYESKQTMLSKDAREKTETRIMNLKRDYENAAKAAEEDLKIAMQRATEELSIEVEKQVAKIAQESNLDVVADLYTGRTVYASKKAMITDDLIREMDKTPAPKKAAKTA